MGINLTPADLSTLQNVDLLTQAIQDWAKRKQQDRSQEAIYLPVLPGYEVSI